MLKKASVMTEKLNHYYYFSFFRYTFVANHGCKRHTVCIYEAKAFYC